MEHVRVTNMYSWVCVHLIFFVSVRRFFGVIMFCSRFPLKGGFSFASQKNACSGNNIGCLLRITAVRLEPCTVCPKALLVRISLQCRGQKKTLLYSHLNLLFLPKIMLYLIIIQCHTKAPKVADPQAQNVARRDTFWSCRSAASEGSWQVTVLDTCVRKASCVQLIPHHIHSSNRHCWSGLYFASLENN